MVLVSRVRDPIEYLKVFIAERVGRALEPHDVVYILKTTAREILPTARLKGKCPQLELFSDWTVHSELDRSPAGQAAIARVAEAFLLHGKNGRDNKWLEEEVNGGISFSALRLELLAVCRHFHLRDDIFSSWEAWQRFALPLAFEVSGRPVILGQNHKAAKDAKDRISRSGLHPDHQPHTLTLLHFEDADKHVNGWRWEAKALAGSVVVQLLLGGFRMSDFPVPADWRSPM